MTSTQVEPTLRLLRGLFKDEAVQKAGVRLWDGTRWPDDYPLPTTLRLNHPGTLRSMFLPGTEVGLGEAYIYNDFNVEGNLEAVFGLADELAQDVNGVLQKLRSVGEPLFLPLAPEIPAAIHDATGIWLDEIPVTPERI